MKTMNIDCSAIHLEPGVCSIAVNLLMVPMSKFRPAFLYQKLLEDSFIFSYISCMGADFGNYERVGLNIRSMSEAILITGVLLDRICAVVHIRQLYMEK